MFKNYLTVALRNICRFKAYSFLIVFGLALGIAVFMLSVIYTGFNFSYDTFHRDADRMYMVVQVLPSGNKGEENSAVVPAPMLQAMVDEYAEIEDSTRISRCRRTIMRTSDHVFYENNILLVDPNFLSFFTFNMKKGIPSSCLDAPNSIVLSEETAVKYFGAGDPLGRILSLDNKIDVTVTGVIENPPYNSTIKYDFLLAMETARQLYGWMDDWAVNSQTTFIKLPEESSPGGLEERLTTFVGKYFSDSPDSPKRLFLLPFLDFRRQVESLDLRSHLFEGIPYVVSYFLIAMAVVLLLVVCINFMNLSTARYMHRTREIGMRKVVGARRIQLVKQFLGESVIISVLSIPFAIGLYYLLEPAFRNYVNPKVNLALWDYPLLCLLLLGSVVVIGLFAGSHPAFFLSSFRPVQALKGNIQIGRRGGSFRKILVVSQFVLSILMIVFTAGIRHQLSFLLKMDPGFNRECVIMVTVPPEAQEQMDLLKKELGRHPDVAMISAANYMPVNWGSRDQVIPEGFSEDEAWTMSVYGVDLNFTELLEMEIIRGRSFSEEFHDSESLILNETAVRQLQWADPLGKEMKLGEKRGVVIGVARDFLFDNAHRRIDPSVLYLKEKNLGYLFVKTHDVPFEAIVDFIKEKWGVINPGIPFSYHLLDAWFESSYRYLEGMYSVFGAIGLFAIFISCLGLVAVAFYTVGKRTKEIGVRKVLGASVSEIIRLLIFGFLKMVVVANIIAWPLTYVLLERFLDWAWAYNTDISIMMFVVTGLLTLIFAVLSVVYQTVKVSLSNPAESLRYE
ncbi:MAG: ABC transporter permease [Candidatus Aminicenantes bacterium]|jgi:putative ABC transport system permease protein